MIQNMIDTIWKSFKSKIKKIYLKSALKKFHLNYKGIFNPCKVYTINIYNSAQRKNINNDTATIQDNIDRELDRELN